MPAKWPIFIKNFSSKLEARDSGATPRPNYSKFDFSKFFAEEYLNAVDTAQTPFGNLHKKSGKKIILEKGFNLAFKMLMESMPPDFAGDLELHKKVEDERYVDLIEPLPSADASYDPYCELEKWTLENKEKLDRFNFHSFFYSTCPAPVDGQELDADFNFNFIRETGEEFNNKVPDNVVLFYLINFNTQRSYKIKYTLNGIEQPLITPDEEGKFPIQVSKNPGKYTYKFLDILDGEGKNVIKEINKSRSITIADGGSISQLDSIDFEMGLNIEQPEILEREERLFIPEMTEAEKIDFIAQRVAFQNDGSVKFKTWLDRLHLGYHRDFGKLVLQRVKSKYSNLRRSDNTLNEYMFQEEHEDHPDNIPDWLTAKLICKFVYVEGIDGLNPLPKKQYILKKTTAFEKRRIDRKIDLYKDEKKRFRDLQRTWVKSQEEKYKKEQEPENNADPYDIMAGAIIAYWISALTQPFKKSPPVLPCNIPSPGLFIPVYYGSRSMLANDLRRAFNMGKVFNVLPATPISSKLVAAAVAVACAKHLLMLKFIYVGKFATPTGPIPMVGFVPVVF